MSNEDLIRQLRTASIQADDMRLRDFGYLMKTASDAIERLEQYNAFWEDEANQAKAYLNELVPKWIPVTKRLPNKDDDVLLYIERTGLSGTVYKETWLCPYTELPRDYKPLYWMPLPAPPKEVDT